MNDRLLENTKMGIFFLKTLFAVDEMERNLIVERTQEGIATARYNPDFREGGKKIYTSIQFDHAIGLLDTNSYNQVVALTGISKSTLIREVEILVPNCSLAEQENSS